MSFAAPKRNQEQFGEEDLTSLEEVNQVYQEKKDPKENSRCCHDPQRKSLGKS
jgi:hypothetical protein